MKSKSITVLLGELRESFSMAMGALVALNGCGKQRDGASSAPEPSSEWSVFEGIEYRAPPGTHAMLRDGVLPGPGGQGGVPTGVRPSVTLTRSGPQNAASIITTKALKPSAT